MKSVRILADLSRTRASPHVLLEVGQHQESLTLPP